MATFSMMESYDHLIDVTSYSYSLRLIFRRFLANREIIPRWLNIVRGLSSERFDRIKYFTEIRRQLNTDQPLRRFLEQETTEIPEYFVGRIRKDLGEFWDWLPDGAKYHDPNAYLLSQENASCACSIPNASVT